METPEFLQGTCNNITPEKRQSDAKTADQFIIEDLLAFPNDDVVTEETLEKVTGASNSYSAVTVVDSCNSSFSGTEPHSTDIQFSSDLCVPYDELAELEWLSNFVEESFSSDDLEKLQLISGMKAKTYEASEKNQFHDETDKTSLMFRAEMSVPAKARSKRSRSATCNWTSRLLVVSPNTSVSNALTITVPSSSSESEVYSGSSGKKSGKATSRKKEATANAAANGGDGRKCLHCATDKTPQWRTGPMGPKTLCNACGVRYKSGRLVPEYRPAASPSFVLTKHSNSHRKVLEIRRQKEMVRAQQQQQQFLHQNMMFNVANGDDYLIHQHIGSDFRQLI